MGTVGKGKDVGCYAVMLDKGKASLQLFKEKNHQNRLKFSQGKREKPTYLKNVTVEKLSFQKNLHLIKGVNSYKYF